MRKKLLSILLVLSLMLALVPAAFATDALRAKLEIDGTTLDFSGSGTAKAKESAAITLTQSGTVQEVLVAGGGVGGFFMGLMNTKNYSGGSPGLLTLPSYIGLDTPMSNFYYACAGAAIAFVVAFIVSFVLFRDEKKN